MISGVPPKENPNREVGDYANWFDEDFYLCKTGIKRKKSGRKGGFRNGPPENYQDYSNKLSEIFPEKGTLLDIGGGYGNRTVSRQQAGFDAYCCDVSKWAYENGVLPKEKYICCDVRELTKHTKKTFYIVSAERCLAYVPKEGAEQAIREIHKVCEKWAVFSIVISDHVHQKNPLIGAYGRLNITVGKFWEELFEKVGFRYDAEKTKLGRLGPEHGFWVCEKV